MKISMNPGTKFRLVFSWGIGHKMTESALVLFTAVALDEYCCFMPSDQEMVHVYLKHIYGLWPNKTSFPFLSIPSSN